jgi:hypothetical protein
VSAVVPPLFGVKLPDSVDDVPSLQNVVFPVLLPVNPLSQATELPVTLQVCAPTDVAAQIDKMAANK